MINICKMKHLQNEIMHTKCKNTDMESGPNGERTRAIQNILARNPHAFRKDKPIQEQNPDVGPVCRCVKSQCLKLYCDCFQSGKVCGPHCMCIKCLNTEAESGPNGRRTAARDLCLVPCALCISLMPLKRK